MKKIFFFSNNDDKITEINNLFKRMPIEVLSIKNFNLQGEPKENGKNFVENAKIKSVYGFNKTNIPCFADDSGICIEALNWAPGSFSKRFMNNFKNKNECFKYIINKIKKRGLVKAYFKTSISLTMKENYHIIFEGVINGIISEKISGNKGFGYDPIFIPNGYNMTFARMNLSKKNSMSHRAIAIDKLKSFLFS